MKTATKIINELTNLKWKYFFRISIRLSIFLLCLFIIIIIASSFLALVIRSTDSYANTTSIKALLLFAGTHY